MGLRFSSAVADELMKGIGEMQESTTYQAIVEKGEAQGRVRGEREMLLHMATRRLGEPSPQAVQWLQTIRNPERFIMLADRVFEVESWDELMAS